MREYVLGTKEAVKSKNNTRPANSDAVQSGRYAPVATVHHITRRHIPEEIFLLFFFSTVNAQTWTKEPEERSHTQKLIAWYNTDSSQASTNVAALTRLTFPDFRKTILFKIPRLRPEQRVDDECGALLE